MHLGVEPHDAFLDAWADYLAGVLEQGQGAYVFFFCPDVRLDPGLCREFHQWVRARGAFPPLP